MIVTTIPSFITLGDLYWGARRDLQFLEAKNKQKNYMTSSET